MNKTKLAFIFAAGLTMGSAMATASAADAGKMAAGKMAAGKPAASGKMGSMHGVHESCHSAMMGGHEHGMGMMGGGYGGGMMMESPRMHMVNALSLSDEQRSKINKLNDALRHDNWETMGKMMDESAKLRDLYEADHRDPEAIDSAYKKIFDLKRKMIVEMVENQNKVEAVLTGEQRAQLKDMRKKMGSMHGYMMH